MSALNGATRVNVPLVWHVLHRSLALRHRQDSLSALQPNSPST